MFIKSYQPEYPSWGGRGQRFSGISGTTISVVTGLDTLNLISNKKLKMIKKYFLEAIFCVSLTVQLCIVYLRFSWLI
jgi:hypothetical protein